MTVYSIWPATNGPDTSGDDGSSINVGTEFSVSGQAWVTGLRFYRGTTSVNPDSLRLYRVDSSSTGTLLGEITSPTPTGTGWQEFDLPSPVELTPAQAYKVVAHMPTHYTATGGYWSGGPGAGGLVNGILTAPDTSTAVGGGQGTFKYGVAAFPDGSFGGGNYWVDVLVTDVDPAGGITVVVGQAVETTSAGAVVPARAVLLGQAVETDTGRPVAAARAALVGQAVETDTARVVAPARAVTVGQAVETNTARPVVVARARRVVQAIETDTAFPVVPSGTAVVPGVHTATVTVAGLTATSR